jgi:hypothetical protein
MSDDKSNPQKGEKLSKPAAAKLTDSTPKEVTEAWHAARDDAAREGGWGVPKNRHGSSGSGSNTKNK